MKRPLLALAALLALTGCHEDYTVYGDISVTFGTGYVYYHSSGWHTETTETSLTVTAQVYEQGEAQMEKGEWRVIDHPPGDEPTVTNPFSRTTLITFPAPGVYQLEYRVDWSLDGDYYRTVAPVEFVIYPTGMG